VGESSASLMAKHAEFADQLTLAMYDSDSNECSSALGVNMALSLVYPGATTESLVDQMESVLGYDAQSSLVWESTVQALTAANDGQCLLPAWDNTADNTECVNEKPTLEIANSLWLDNGYSMMATYEQIVGDLVKPMDLQSSDAGTRVNAWVEDNTNGLIETIVQEGPFSEGTFLVAVNSIYLKASWQTAFRDQWTRKNSFYTTRYNQETSFSSEAHFMHALNAFPYSDTALQGYQMVQLPFYGGSLSMIVVLPLADNLGMAPSSNVMAALSQLTPTRVALSLPKFKFESTYESTLKNSLMSIGLTEPFDAGALSGGFCGLVEGRCGYIDSIIQKTVIDVHESGVEAAAVTALTMRTTSVDLEDVSKPVLVAANSPFQFFIYDEFQDVVLFEGRVTNPGISSSDDKKAIEEMSELNFWSETLGVSPYQVARDANSHGYSILHVVALSVSMIPTLLLTLALGTHYLS